MDEVALAVEDVKRAWDQTVAQIQDSLKEIQSCGKSGRGIQELNSLPRLNGAAQDGLALLRSLQFKLDLLAQQLPTEEAVVSAQAALSSWKEQYQGCVFILHYKCFVVTYILLSFIAFANMLLRFREH